MFKHILIPTAGSAFPERAVDDLHVFASDPPDSNPRPVVEIFEDQTL